MKTMQFTLPFRKWYNLSTVNSFTYQAPINNWLATLYPVGAHINSGREIFVAVGAFRQDGVSTVNVTMSVDLRIRGYFSNPYNNLFSSTSTPTMRQMIRNPN